MLPSWRAAFLRRSTGAQQRKPSSSSKSSCAMDNSNTKHSVASTNHHNKDKAGDKQHNAGDTVRRGGKDNAVSKIPHSMVVHHAKEETTQPCRHHDASLLATELPFPLDDDPSIDKKESLSLLEEKSEAKPASLASVQPENRLPFSRDSLPSNRSVVSSKKVSVPARTFPDRKPSAALRNTTNNAETSVASTKNDDSISILPPWEKENQPVVVDHQAPSAGHKSKRRARRKDHPQARSLGQSKPPRTFYSHGMKVTVVDWATKVFAIDMVPHNVCDLIRSLTDKHVAHSQAAGHPAWRTLYTYTKMDIPCGEVPGMAPIMHRIFVDVTRVVADVFGQPQAAAFLRPRSWKEPHLLKYQKIKDKPSHVGVEMHYDGSDFTWTLMLSDRSEYQGGGTYFRCLRKTIKLRKGQVLVHPGDLYHKGVDITKGTRHLVVCFMDGFSSGIVDESSESEDRSEYEKRVVKL